MPELNEKYKAPQNKPIGTEKLDIADKSLRQHHIDIENLFDNIKTNKSARDFKWLFLLLLSLVLIATAIHMIQFGIGFNSIPILLVIGYWVYYRYQLKKAIEQQARANLELNNNESEEQDNQGILLNRSQYILNGIVVLEQRISLVRNQFVLLFPVFTMVVIDIIRGPMGWGAFAVTAVISIVLGGGFWIYYFRNDLIDLENATDELEEIQEKLKQK